MVIFNAEPRQKESLIATCIMRGGTRALLIAPNDALETQACQAARAGQAAPSLATVLARCRQACTRSLPLTVLYQCS
ncbi:MAG: hypothetical protein HYR55_02630 [Acidobacteria bacterium]|nr:hypothetical protein [Acidobacteriota bacterium]MBI3656490.1 hypothetical protein [Acidobacteriota bacterium]